MDKQEQPQPAPEMNPPPSDDGTPVEPEPTLGEWFKKNGPVLAIVVALLAFLFYKFDGDELWVIAKVALGLSLVIFVHELGHFLVAKWCDVHVQTFSIGFGPAIPGCSFKWGETTYKFALFPLGGYVQMVGQVDGDESSDGSDDDPRSYRRKTVGQRMAIISAGVIMNVILAVICFILIYMTHGRDRIAGVVGSLDTNGPAWRQGVRTGSEILQIGNVRDPSFDSLRIQVSSTHSGECVQFITRRPGDKTPQDISIEPRKDPNDPNPVIGIGSAPRLTFVRPSELRRRNEPPVFRYSAAARANPAFEYEDEIIGMTDPSRTDLHDDKKYDPTQVTPLPEDPRHRPAEGRPQRDYFEFLRRMQLLAGKEVSIEVRRNGETKQIRVPPEYHFSLGVLMHMGPVVAVREQSAADGKVQAREKDDSGAVSREGDLILWVKVQEPDGSCTWFGPKDLENKLLPFDPQRLPRMIQQLIPASLKGKLLPLDPVRLPSQLRQWADRWERTGAGKSQGKEVVLYVQRTRAAGGKQYHEQDLTLKWDNTWRFDRGVPQHMESPLAIQELGLAYLVKNSVVAREEGAPKGGSDTLQPGDVITEVQFYRAGRTREDPHEKGSWLELEPDQWARVFWVLQYEAEVKELNLKVKRGKETREITLKARPDKSWPLEERGLLLALDRRLKQADNFGQAVMYGLEDTHSAMLQVYYGLRGMIIGRISIKKNLGGPITIANVAYRIAGVDFWEFVFFLGLISINLAVINFLPIPVLDGGHMVFLLYEKIRGKPASEGVRVGATYAGLLLLASLMIFVLYLDITRFF